MKDEDIMLAALGRERAELHGKIMQLDRLIKKVKAGEYLGSKPQAEQLPIQKTDPFPQQVDIKIQIPKVFEIVGKASKLAAL